MSIGSVLKSLIPIWLRRRRYRLWEDVSGWWRWRHVCSQKVTTGQGVRVFYGRDRMPGSGEPVQGGFVKVQRLHERFPNTPDDFNLLYMVSSSLPYEGLQLAQAARRNGGIRLVWNQNGVAYPGWHGPDWEWTNAPMKELHAIADHVFYQSDFCKRSAERYLGARQGSSEVLYNAVDTTLFTPAASDPDPHCLVLLLGGTQYQFYRLDCAFHVLDALRRRKTDAKLLVTGRLTWVPDEARARREAMEVVQRLRLENAVSFLGPYTQAQATDIYRKAHLLLHTKVNDPSPGLIAEAMACGLPIVYSKSGGVPELVGDEAGIGVPVELNWERDIPPDPDAMAQAVATVAADRARFAGAARQRAVERFDLGPWMQRHRDVFEKLVG